VSDDDAARERARKRWAPYAACPDCRALPGAPCRELVYTRVRFVSRPHHGRPTVADPAPAPTA
jgi:hypothetical protein